MHKFVQKSVYIPNDETSCKGSMSNFIMSVDDENLVLALRNGDELAFVTLIERYHPALVKMAMIFVGDESVAEEVAQETWIAVLQGLDNFEKRSSLKTWIFSILTNRAKTRGRREGRTIPFSMLWSPDDDLAEPSVAVVRFEAPGHPSAGHWLDTAKPSDWDSVPEDRLLSKETGEVIQRAISSLPLSQQEVITLRDIAGWNSEEVCNILNISDTNQRVLLHRARSKVRRALEQYLDEA